MNKKELVAAVAEQAGLKKVDAEKAIEAFTAVVEGALKAGDKVQLVGFGTFEVAERPEREGRNPRSGETMTIAASKNPKKTFYTFGYRIYKLHFPIKSPRIFFHYTSFILISISVYILHVFLPILSSLNLLIL